MTDHEARAGGAAALRRALDARGLACEVEPRDRLAVLLPHDAGVARRLADAGERGAVVTLAAAHGFTHVALELDPPAPGAALSGD